jgi:hypothetical protein
MPFQSQKNAAYDNAVYLARFAVNMTKTTAGSGGTSEIYWARGNEILWSIGARQVTAGTSTYTTTTTLYTGGTSTTVVNTNTAATLIQPFRVNVTGTTTTTTTFQTFAVAAANSTNGTEARQNYTNAANAVAGGGVILSAGDQVYYTNGTDTSAVTVPVLEMSIAPLANVTA